MTATRISDLAVITALDPGDLLVAVDVSDTSMAASGTNKQITVANALPASGAYDPDNTTAWVDAFGAASAYDCEFNRTTGPTGLPTNWLFQNQNSATYLEQLGKGRVSIASGSNSIGAPTLVVQPVSAAGAYTAVGKLSRHQQLSAGTGLVLSDGTKCVGIIYNSNPLVLYSRWSDFPGGIYTDNPGTTTVTAADGTLVRYWRIVKHSGTNYDFGFSYDGVTWIDTITGVDVSAFLTPTHFGFLLSQISGPQEFALDWFRVR